MRARPAPLWHLFAELRHALGLTRQQVAARLATTATVVAALETGDDRGLPQTPELNRVIATYLGLAGIDARPVLRAIEAQRRSGPARNGPPEPGEGGAGAARVPQGRDPLVPAGTADPAHAREETVTKVAASPDPGREARDQLIGRARDLLSRPILKRGLTGLGLVSVLALMAWNSLLSAAVAALAPPVASAVRHAHEFVLVQMSPQREGLRWIEVADPRSRRGDKLQIARQ